MRYYPLGTESRRAHMRDVSSACVKGRSDPVSQVSKGLGPP